MSAPQSDAAQVSAECRDCGLDNMPMDTVLTIRQWEMICPEGGVLCASCIVWRAARLPGVYNLTARITFTDDLDAPGGRFFQFMKEQDARASDEPRDRFILCDQEIVMPKYGAEVLAEVLAEVARETHSWRHEPDPYKQAVKRAAESVREAVRLKAGGAA